MEARLNSSPWLTPLPTVHPGIVLPPGCEPASPLMDVPGGPQLAGPQRACPGPLQPQRQRLALRP